ncbi:hypothetical protein I8J29_19950 [Paenibacillus sp. MWE-103]|uniref:Uncharacterized protein n=1 Tax=Paenibacillus artemisiicola TaxID=1172618 RepID=A0ABS3WDR1_9BACL|nr:hypothetical protein [Paenibacillus artemisiicola]MBO7746491.1 hypothetical protein [Paenibacillus artemisiicola]
MRRQTIKTAFVGGAVALIVLFGIDIATSGIERINGPVDTIRSALPGMTAATGTSGATGTTGLSGSYGEDRSQAQGDALLPERDVVIAPVPQMTVQDAQHGRTEEEIRREYERKLQEELAKRLPGLPAAGSQSTVNQVADGTAGVLQSISAKGIRLVVSFFEKVTD